jgi:hypothetical protein
MKHLNKTIHLNAENRFELWESFINQNKFKFLLELGVYKGEFAEYILKQCPEITSYTMLDPWRNLSDWNKPANTDNTEFEGYYKETIYKTKFAQEKICILRGKTTEVIQQVNDASLDFAYIDGDHTLKGITIDLIGLWGKIKRGGYIAGDDFCPSIWQHSRSFEPTFVFPFAIYFAEAVGAKIYALPFNQFLIEKQDEGFEFIDLTADIYSKKDVLSQVSINENKVITRKGWLDRLLFR